jgi:GNAT superfamily N-acetyltransferase
MQPTYGDYTIQPLTPNRWDDFETLFGPSGAYSGCWCMWWRIKGNEFEANGNAGNRAAIQEIVQQGPAPGLLAYRDGTPVGWLSLGPRPDFGRVERSPLFKAVDDTPVWSIVCFFIHKDFRRQGVAKALLEAAIDYAQAQGAPALEAYPIDLDQADGSHQGEAAIFTGTANFFGRAGFEIVRRSKPARPMMRKSL